MFKVVMQGVTPVNQMLLMSMLGEGEGGGGGSEG